MEKKGDQQLFYLLNPSVSTKQNLLAEECSAPVFCQGFKWINTIAAYEANVEASLGSPQRTFTSSSTWGFQPNGKTNDGCTRVNSSCTDRAAQGLFWRELWGHFTSTRPRSLARRELQRSLGNIATYGTRHCHELLQWGGAGCSWTEDGTAGSGVLLLPSLCPLQVAASSLTRASPQPCISANLTKHFLPSNTRDKNYLKPLLPHDPLHCLALRSRANSSPWGAEVRGQNRLFHLLTDVNGDAPD